MAAGRSWKVSEVGFAKVRRVRSGQAGSHHDVPAEAAAAPSSRTPSEPSSIPSYPARPHPATTMTTSVSLTGAVCSKARAVGSAAISLEAPTCDLAGPSPQVRSAPVDRDRQPSLPQVLLH